MVVELINHDSGIWTQAMGILELRPHLSAVGSPESMTNKEYIVSRS